MARRCISHGEAAKPRRRSEQHVIYKRRGYQGPPCLFEFGTSMVIQALRSFHTSGLTRDRRVLRRHIGAQLTHCRREARNRNMACLPSSGLTLDLSNFGRSAHRKERSRDPAVFRKELPGRYGSRASDSFIETRDIEAVLTTSNVLTLCPGCITPCPRTPWKF